MTLPAGKVLIPGLIAHSTNVVEHPDLVAERLLRYADIGIAPAGSWPSWGRRPRHIGREWF